MISHYFDYRAPTRPEEAVEAIATDPENTRVLGGGTWVVPELHRGETCPTHVVDLRRLGLDRITRENGYLWIGATTTYAQLQASSEASFDAPLLVELAARITGGEQIHNQGTVGGSVCYAKPGSDAPGALATLGAVFRLVGPMGARDVPASSFFVGAHETAARRDEVLAWIAVPAQRSVSWGYEKLKLRESSWPIATASCILDIDADGACTSVALGLGGVAAAPLQVPIDDIVVGTQVGIYELKQVTERAHDVTDEPWSDELADGAYRAAVAGIVARRALETAHTRAAGRG